MANIYRTTLEIPPDNAALCKFANDMWGDCNDLTKLAKLVAPDDAKLRDHINDEFLVYEPIELKNGRIRIKTKWRYVVHLLSEASRSLPNEEFRITAFDCEQHAKNVDSFELTFKSGNTLKAVRQRHLEDGRIVVFEYPLDKTIDALLDHFNSPIGTYEDPMPSWVKVLPKNNGTCGGICKKCQLHKFSEWSEEPVHKIGGEPVARVPTSYDAGWFAAQFDKLRARGEDLCHLINGEWLEHTHLIVPKTCPYVLEHTLESQNEAP